VLTVFLLLILGLSLAVNAVLMYSGKLNLDLSESDGGSLTEHFHSGKDSAKDKIAIVKIDTVLMEGNTGFALKQIDAAAADNKVKAVIVRVNSPGGSITASDDLHHRLIELRDGKNIKQKGGAKTLVVSMGAIAASGGYYISVPAKHIVAETTTITGSIGVYAAFPNIAGLADKYGFGMNVIKAGAVKDSGSMFKKMTPQEKQLWQDMVDSAYGRFIDVVETGRPDLKGKMLETVIKKDIPADDKVPEGVEKKPMVEYTRYRADGGIYTAKEAKEFGLIDQIGYLDDAIQKTASLAGLGSDYKVISYEKQATLSSILFGTKAPQPGGQLTAGKLAAGATPRLWFLAPQSELAGILAAMGGE